jgi:hypothetical protein
MRQTGKLPERKLQRTPGYTLPVIGLPPSPENGLAEKPPSTNEIQICVNVPGKTTNTKT